MDLYKSDPTAGGMPSRRDNTMILFMDRWNRVGSVMKRMTTYLSVENGSPPVAGTIKTVDKNDVDDEKIITRRCCSTDSTFLFAKNSTRIRWFVSFGIIIFCVGIWYMVYGDGRWIELISCKRNGGWGSGNARSARLRKLAVFHGVGR